MSVAGILAGSLFSGAGAQFAQKTPLSTVGTSNAPASFAAVQQKLSESHASAPMGTTPVSSELAQLGQDLKSGNLSAAQADYSALRISLAQRHAHLSGQLGASASGNNSSAGASGTSSGAISDPLAAAMLAYSSLQQSPAASGLSSSLMVPGSTFSIDA